MHIFAFQLYDRIASAAIVPARAPPGDAVLRCRDAVEAISALATGGGTLGTSRHSSKQHAQERGELLHLLAMPHIQVSLAISDHLRVKCLDTSADT